MSTTSSHLASLDEDQKMPVVQEGGRDGDHGDEVGAASQEQEQAYDPYDTLDRVLARKLSKQGAPV